MFTLLKMTRPINIVIAIVTLMVGYYLQGKSFAAYSYIFQALGFAFAIGFANIQNDILDLESDKLNRPERPLVKGIISKKTASIFVKLFFALTLLCGIADDILEQQYFTSIIFFFCLSMLLILYNKKLKHIPLIKNMTVAFLCITPLLITLISFENFLDKFGKIYPAMIFAFLLTFAREIYKDLEDEIGDLKAGIMTFPLIAGSKTATRFANTLCLFCLAVLPLPVMQGFYPKLFLIITFSIFIPLTFFILKFVHQKNFRAAQKTVKATMFLGLLALIISC